MLIRVQFLFSYDLFTILVKCTRLHTHFFTSYGLARCNLLVPEQPYQLRAALLAAYIVRKVTDLKKSFSSRLLLG